MNGCWFDWLMDAGWLAGWVLVIDYQRSSISEEADGCRQHAHVGSTAPALTFLPLREHETRAHHCQLQPAELGNMQAVGRGGHRAPSAHRSRCFIVHACRAPSPLSTHKSQRRAQHHHSIPARARTGRPRTPARQLPRLESSQPRLCHCHCHSPTPRTPSATAAKACASPRLSPSTTHAVTAPESTLASASAPRTRRVSPAPGRKGGYLVEPVGAVGASADSRVRRSGGSCARRARAALSVVVAGRTVWCGVLKGMQSATQHKVQVASGRWNLQQLRVVLVGRVERRKHERKLHAVARSQTSDERNVVVLLALEPPSAHHTTPRLPSPSRPSGELALSVGARWRSTKTSPAPPYTSRTSVSLRV